MYQVETERCKTVSLGTNELLKSDYYLLAHSFNQISSEIGKKESLSPIREGKAASWIIKTLISIYN